MKLLCFLLLIGLFSCNHEPQPKTFADLSEKELSNLKAELLDSMRAEIFRYPIYANKDTTRRGHPGGCFIGTLNWLIIRVNDQKEVDVSHEMDNRITASVYQFYSANKNTDQPKRLLPVFYTLSNTDLKEQINYLFLELKSLEENHAPLELISFKKEQISELKTKQWALKVLGKKEMKIPNSPIQVILEYTPSITEVNAIQDSVLLAYCNLRSDDSELSFKKSYVELFFEAKSSGDFSKIDALSVLTPIEIVDEPNLKKYETIRIGVDAYPVEVPPLIE